MTGFRFEFAAREHCVCGARLPDQPATVTRRLPYGEVRFARCASCASWCQSPVLTEASLARWVDSPEYQGSSQAAGVGYANYAADEAPRVLEAAERYDRNLKHLLKARSTVLEAGCATGSLLSVIREHGHTVVGADLSPAFAARARELYGLDVKVGSVSDVPLPAARFDAILAFGTASNFRDLHACLLRFRELLAPEGLLFFNFPDAASRWVRWLYRDRFWMFTPSVITFMTARGCALALERAGFAIRDLGPDFQRPSLRKLLHHGRAGFLLRVLGAAGIADARVTLAFRVPTVRLVVASLAKGGTRTRAS